MVAEVISNPKYIDAGENFMIDSNVAMVGLGAQPETDKGGDQDMPHKAKITSPWLDQIPPSQVKLYVRKFSKPWKGNLLVSPSRWKEAAGPPAGYPVNIEVSGEDYDELIQVAENLKQFLNNESIPV